MRWIDNGSGDSFAGATAEDIVRQMARKGPFGSILKTAAQLRKYMQDTIGGPAGAAIQGADQFLAAMAARNQGRLVHGQTHGLSGIGSLGARGGELPPLSQWENTGSGRRFAFDDGREAQVWETKGGWAIAVGYAAGANGLQWVTERGELVGARANPAAIDRNVPRHTTPTAALAAANKALASVPA